MKFIVSWSIPGSTAKSAIDRFLATGAVPPAGTKLVGRWHGANATGFAILETSDPKAVYEFCATWFDCLNIQCTPCLEDADAGAVPIHSSVVGLEVTPGAGVGVSPLCERCSRSRFCWSASSSSISRSS